MVINKKKFGLKLMEVVLDSEKAQEVIGQKNKYDHINIVSYESLEVGDDFKVKEKQSARIKLGGDIEAVMNNFDKTTKKHIRRALKMENLKVKLLDEDLDKTYSAYVDFEKANGRRPFAKDSFQGLLLFNIYDGDDIISSVLCYDTKPALKAHSIFSKRLKTEDKEKYKMIAYATRRLVYEMCQFGLEKGYTILDLGSLNFEDKAKAGITNFKMTFNPAVEKEYHYIYQSSRFKLANKIKKLFIR